MQRKSPHPDYLNGFNETITGQQLRERIWVDNPLRRDGWGGRLLGAMEQYAQSKGISNYHLETTSFQALPFYQKQGYEVFGQLPDMPPGHISYFLKKQDE
ncbi:GNAT family N-acetyltransferase [Aeromonas australiensis]|uniref:GNAT family N-acetyltransferase n=1 Tax=Aeromonas australiensis TaxID=1114880 RepID=UPI000589CD5E|nr:GNAT family N-acetyltransferase [Aeromonas australiensis]